ncbi:MAG: hypothetical protein HQK78_15200 [Desulfobacterales bacterium]|nr:hypothetical protein [Desulfobacterales bacterium]
MQFSELYNYSWPPSMLAESIEILAKKAKYISKPVDIPLQFKNIEATDKETLTIWIRKIAEHVGIEAEPVEFLYSDIDDMLYKAAPALIYLPLQDEQRFLIFFKGDKIDLKL